MIRIINYFGGVSKYNTFMLEYKAKSKNEKGFWQQAREVKKNEFI